MFNSLKAKVLATIQENSHMEITNKTNFKDSGIYMIYIDNFTDEKIIPIYIGQTINFQKRYKQHLSEIMTLNRFEYDHYISLLFDGFYEGHYKSCKIFKYMLEHNCSLRDFHMIILENVSKDDLDKKEQEYFNVYKSAFFGFNQLNTRLEIIKYYFSEKKFTEYEYCTFCNVVAEDIRNIIKYKDYGYTLFNFKRAFIDKLPYADDKNIENFKNIRHLINDINFQLKRLREDIFNSNELGAEAKEKELQIKVRELRLIRNELYDKKNNLVENIIIPKIVGIFAEYRIRSSSVYKDFTNSLLLNNEDTKKKFLRYVQKRGLGVDFYDMFHLEIDEMNIIKSELNQYGTLIDKILDESKALYNKKINEILYLIKPSKKYDSFPLKDMYYQHNFKCEPKLKNNICEINIAISSNVRNKQPEIVKIDYRITNENKIIEKKDIFIKNFSTGFWENDDTRYFEKDYMNRWVFTKEPFKLGLWDCDGQYWLATFISIDAEFKTGINDYTIKGRTLIDLKEIVKEIEKYTNENTLFMPTISESTTCLKSSFYCENKRTLNLAVVKALMSYEKPHHK